MSVRVLVIAEACNPEWVSVPLVGYNLYSALREVADVHLVTQVRNRKALAASEGDTSHITFIDSDCVAGPAYRFAQLLTLGKGLGWTTKQAIMWGPYLYFEYLVWKRFKADLKAGRYDLVHRVTPLSPTYASPLASWIPVPFVLGPLNGGLPWPKGTTRTRFAEMEFLSYFRNVYRVLPYVRRTYQRAACIIAGSHATMEQLPAQAKPRAVYMPENGIDASRFSAAGRQLPSQITPRRILFVGRLVPYKGADVVIDAFAGSETLRSDCELMIVGDGPQRPTLETQVDELQIRDKVTFTGRLPQPDVVQHFRAASVFAFPSLREFGGGVVLEAMACGLPSIVLDHGGPAELITPETGIKLPVADRRTRVASLRNELETLLADPQRLDSMSTAGRQRVEQEFTWPRKAQKIVDIYNSILTPELSVQTVS